MGMSSSEWSTMIEQLRVAKERGSVRAQPLTAFVSKLHEAHLIAEGRQVEGLLQTWL